MGYVKKHDGGVDGEGEGEEYFFSYFSHALTPVCYLLRFHRDLAEDRVLFPKKGEREIRRPQEDRLRRPGRNFIARDH